MPQYEFDNRNFSFRKVTLSVWTVVRRVVRWVVGSMTLAVVYYLVLSLFVRTDTERQLAQENRMYARLYPKMQEQMALVGDVVEDLRIRDDAIYNQVFHTKAPSVNPGRSLEMLPDTVSERNVVALVEQKADRLTQTASRVESDFLALSEEEWLGLSDTIRRFHEITHVICRRLYPDNIDSVRDEAIADAVGLFAAFGRFDPEKAALCLGIKDGRYIGGRLENYTDDPEREAARAADLLDMIGKVVGPRKAADAFDLIPPLMEALPAFAGVHTP